VPGLVLGEEFTIAVWAKPSVIVVGGAVVSGIYTHIIQIGGGSYSPWQVGLFSSETYPQRPTVGRWDFLVVTQTKSGQKSYINANLYGERSLTYSAGQHSIAMIGKRYDAVYFHGTIDDFRFYNKVLTLAEIQSLYGMGGD